MNLETLPRPQVELVGQDGNAYAVLGRCAKAARKAGWTPEQIEEFRVEATSGDYDKLLQTVIKYCDDVAEEDYEECQWCGAPMRHGICTDYCVEVDEEEDY